MAGKKPTFGVGKTQLLLPHHLWLHPGMKGEVKSEA